MTSTEVPQLSDVEGWAKKLIDQGPSDNYNHRQIQLAYEAFTTDHSEVVTGKSDFKQMMEDWHSNNLDESFGKIVENSQFSMHKRLQGKVSNVTVDDVRYYSKEGMLPEN